MNEKKLYEFGSYDKLGNLNSPYFVSMLFLIFIGSYIIAFSLVDIVKYYNNFNEIITVKTVFKDLFSNFKSIYYKGFLGSINSYKLYMIFSLSCVIFYIFYVFKYKDEQEKLAGYGLENYYLKKKLKEGYIYEVVSGCVMDYDKFLKQFDNMVQRNGMGSCEIKRINKIGVMVRFKHKTPSIELLKDLRVKDYMKQGKLFLGFSGGFKKKTVPQWVNFKDLPHSFALLGTSGGGKSNTLNHILFSVFRNFNIVDTFIMVDFKGGVEAQPYQKLEDRYKTGKINIYSSSRLELYKMLVRLDITNKARQQYLISKEKKKFTNKFIFVFFDEIAEILDFKGNNKEDKLIQDKTKEIIESLFRTGRSSGFKLFYATQIFTSVGSGLSNSIKNNTIFRILHKTESSEGIHSVIDAEPLQERGINVKEFEIGEMVIKNEDKYFNVRSLYVPDNFVNDIRIPKSKIDKTFKSEMDKLITEQIKQYSFEENIYSSSQCMTDFNLAASENYINTKKPIETFEEY